MDEYTIRLVRPKYVSKAEMKAYIKDAVCGWKGGMHTDEPITDLDYRKVKVVSKYQDHSDAHKLLSDMLRHS